MSNDWRGKDWPLRVTKYWDDDQQEMIYSTKIRDEPIELRKILGYYEWVFNAYEEEDKEIESGSHGFLTLVADKKGRKVAEDIDPTHIKGEFDTCGIGSAFVGLNENGDCSWTFDGTHLVKTPEEEGDDDDGVLSDDSEFFIGVADVVDDNGIRSLCSRIRLGCTTLK
ncbi:hypothetical protein K438DRAFT_2009753 [Mycena galopus ATCC 62051]|nr:hypothetical protein K438DRAFT_2009753 [Mycena galopus ATCC 62051]